MLRAEVNQKGNSVHVTQAKTAGELVPSYHKTDIIPGQDYYYYLFKIHSLTSVLQYITVTSHFFSHFLECVQYSIYLIWRHVCVSYLPPTPVSTCQFYIYSFHLQSLEIYLLWAILTHWHSLSWLMFIVIWFGDMSVFPTCHLHPCQLVGFYFLPSFSLHDT